MINRNIKELIENRMCDGRHVVFAKKWLAEKLITVYDDKLYITPIINTFKMNLKKSICLTKREISDIRLAGNMWVGKKIEIDTRNAKYTFSLPNSSWVNETENLIKNWFNV